jgi:hypothetical protein
MTQGRALALASVALAVAVFLGLLAVDVLHRKDSLASGDLHFDVYRYPGQSDPWKASEIIPFGAARALLGVGDELRYRNADWLYVLSQPGALATIGLAPERAQAQGALEDAIASEHDARRKSELMNMLGIVAVNLSASSLIGDPNAVRQSVADFRSAIRVDPANADAKSNLELVLRVLDRQRRQSAAAHGSVQPRKGPKAGLGTSGSGY